MKPEVPHPLILHKICEWHHRFLKLCHFLEITLKSEVRHPLENFLAPPLQGICNWNFVSSFILSENLDAFEKSRSYIKGRKWHCGTPKMLGLYMTKS